MRKVASLRRWVNKDLNVEIEVLGYDCDEILEALPSDKEDTKF